MNRRRFVVTGMSAAVAGAIATACSARGGLNALEKLLPGLNPGELAAAGTTLVPQYASVEMAGYKMRLRTYNGKTVGPTIETRPGETLSIRIDNKLPPNPKSSVPRGPVPMNVVENSMQAMNPKYLGARTFSRYVDPMNNPHDFNTTNLHVHGIQTVPHLFDPVGTSKASAEMIAIEPGKSFQYHFPIPSDHPSGLQWYHPHHHGATDVQVSGGMAGLIVVRGEIDDVPEIKAARELFIVIQSIEVNESKTQKGWYDREYIAFKSPHEGGYQLDADYAMLTTNGEPTNWYDVGKGTSTAVGTPPQFDVQPGEVVRIRLLNGTNFIPLMLVLPGFESWEIGRDGINLLEATSIDMSGRGVALITPENLFSAPIRYAFSANRIELLIRAPGRPGTYTLSSLANSGFMGNFPTLHLATFAVAGAPVSMSVPEKLPVPTREYPLIAQKEIKTRRKYVFSQGSCTEILTGLCFMINDELYKEAEATDRPAVGTCEEWRIENSTPDGHPFHLHTNSFQLIAINDQKVDPVQIWDTFVVPPKVGPKNGSITIRIRFKQWYGKDVFHCHILPHEDTGMMRNFLLV